MPEALLFEHNMVPTFIINADHVVTHFNRACAQCLGLDANKVLHKKGLGHIIYGYACPVMADLIVDGVMKEIIDDPHQHKYRRSLTVVGAFETEGFFPQLGAAGRWLFFTAAPLCDASGAVIGAIETLQDITERKLADSALLATQLASEQMLEKYLASLYDMLNAYEQSESAHGNPHVLRDLAALKKKIDFDYLKEDIPTLMVETKEGLVRVRKIMQDLKDFLHVDTTREWQYANLNQGIDSTLNLVNNEVHDKADVVREYGVLPEVQCLHSQINQVVLNLVVNAAHAMGATRGTISIRTGCDNALAWFEVQDNGSGIPKEVLPRIFDPFYTTKPVGKGTGLGLSLSYGIIQRHHGSIDVQTEPGKGTTFRVTIPLAQTKPRNENSQWVQADTASCATRSRASI